jgi:hypothetical protein
VHTVWAFEKNGRRRIRRRREDFKVVGFDCCWKLGNGNEGKK